MCLVYNQHLNKFFGEWDHFELKNQQTNAINTHSYRLGTEIDAQFIQSVSAFSPNWQITLEKACSELLRQMNG